MRVTAEAVLIGAREYDKKDRETKEPTGKKGRSALFVTPGSTEDVSLMIPDELEADILHLPTMIPYTLTFELGRRQGSDGAYWSVNLVDLAPANGNGHAAK